MKKAFASMIGLLAAAAGAQQDVGRVVSTVPVLQQVAVPRQVCTQQQVVAPQSSGGGALIGAVVGGLLGNTIGHGFGRAAATGAGVMAGAVVGNNLETRGAPQVVQQCSTQYTYESRAVGYNVTYEYAGRQYTVQMPYDPGPTVRLQITPVGSGPMAAPPAAQAPWPASEPAPGAGAPPAPVMAPPMTQAEPAVVVQAPVMAAPVVVAAAPAPVYVVRSAPPPVRLSIGLGYTWIGHRHHHWH